MRPIRISGWWFWVVVIVNDLMVIGIWELWKSVPYGD